MDRVPTRWPGKETTHLPRSVSASLTIPGKSRTITSVLISLITIVAFICLALMSAAATVSYASSTADQTLATATALPTSTPLPMTAASVPITVSIAGPVGQNNIYTSNTVTASLTAPTTAGAVQLFYRLLPAAGYTPYIGPFPITGQGTHLLYDYAVSTAGVQPAQQVTVTLDSLPPSTTARVISPVPHNGWYRGTVVLDLKAIDVTSGVSATYLQKDGGAFALAGAQVTLQDSGWRHLAYYSVDRAGNVEPAHTLLIPLDNTPPVLHTPLVNDVAYPQGIPVLAGPATITLGASDTLSGLAGILYRIDGDPWATYHTPLRITHSGPHMISYRALDKAGNQSPDATLNVTIAGLPHITLSLAGVAGTNGWYRSAVQAQLTASDDGNPAQARYSLDGGVMTTATGPVTISGDGLHHLFYQAIATGGVSAPSTAQLAIDTVPPTINAHLDSNPGPAGWYLHSVTIHLTATDATSGVAAIYYQKDGKGAFARYTQPIGLSRDGIRLLTYYAVDRAGNPTTMQRLYMKLDTQAPSSGLTVTGVTHNGAYVQIAVLTLHGTDDVSGVATLYYSLDNGTTQRYTGSLALSAPGRHVLTYFAVDAAGNLEHAHQATIYVTPASALTPTVTPIPTLQPTLVPTASPTVRPTATFTAIPTATPQPTHPPTTTPLPTMIPTSTAFPTTLPTAIPTHVPTQIPSLLPTAAPSALPTAPPPTNTARPTALPTSLPQPTATAIPAGFTPYAIVVASSDIIGYKRAVRLMGWSVPALPGSPVILQERLSLHGAWKTIRGGTEGHTGHFAWWLYPSQSAAYRVIVANSITSRIPLDVRVRATIDLQARRVNLQGHGSLRVEDVVLLGQARPDQVGHRVVLQCEGVPACGPRGHWHTLASATLQTGGYFRFGVQVTWQQKQLTLSHGAHVQIGNGVHLRVWDPPTSGLMGNVSNIVALHAVKS